MPEISVIIPVYNKEKYIGALLRSVLEQSFSNIEVISVNDGSTDGSLAIMNQAAADDRIHVVNTTNGGVSRARNIGMRFATGKYVTFIDADDRVPNDYLERLYNTITENNADIAICTVTKFWTTGKELLVKSLPNGVYSVDTVLPKFSTVQKETGIFGYCGGKIFHRHLAEGLSFDEQLHLAEDFDFMLSLYSSVKTICFTDETTYYYLQEAMNSTALAKDERIDYFAQLKVHLHHKHFLEQCNAYSCDNEAIVSQLLSNYVFYSLFYCTIKQLNKRFRDLRAICSIEMIQPKGRDWREKLLLRFLFHNHLWLTKITLLSYRAARKLRRR